MPSSEHSFLRTLHQLRFPILTILFCCGLSLWSVRTILPAPTRLVPTTLSGSSTVPLFNAWTMVWNAVQTRDGFDSYWDAPIFFPQRGTFAFSEPQPATVLMAPLILIFGSPALACNVWLILSLTLNGLFTGRLLRQLGVSRLAGMATSAAAVLLPMIHDQLDVLQLVPLWPTLWTLTAVMNLRRTALEVVTAPASYRPCLKAGAEAGIACFCVAACSIHHWLFLMLLLGFCGWMMIPWFQLRRWWPGAVAALCVSGVLILPMLIPMKKILHGPQYKRPDATIAALSARADDLLKVSSGALLKTPGITNQGSWFLCPGWARTALAAIAVCGLLKKQLRLPRREVCFLLSLAVVSAVFSMGVNLQIGSWKPWITLSTFLPGFSSIRSVFRFGYFYQLSLLLISGIGLNLLIERLKNASLASALRNSVLTCLAGFMIFEVLPSGLRSVRIPLSHDPHPWLDHIGDRLSKNKGVLLLPYPPGSGVDQYEATTRWMICCTLRRIPIMNGYSGFFPQPHFRLQQLLQSGTLTPECLKMLRASGIEYIVTFPGDPITPVLHNTPKDLQSIQKQADGTEVFQLHSP
ncbi:MAG: hypothetical protein WCK86_07510 [Planctomycetia bacterium]